MKDMNGIEFRLGQTVAKAYHQGDLRLLKVIKIQDDKVYLTGESGRQSNCLVYPHQVLIIDG